MNEGYLISLRYCKIVAHTKCAENNITGYIAGIANILPDYKPRIKYDIDFDSGNTSLPAQQCVAFPAKNVITVCSVVGVCACVGVGTCASSIYCKPNPGIVFEGVNLGIQCKVGSCESLAADISEQLFSHSILMITFQKFENQN